MNLTLILLLTFIQSATEFLPISSSGHLELARHLYGERNQWSLAFDALLHLGTLFSVIIVFRHRLLSLGRSFLNELAAFNWRKASSFSLTYSTRYAVYIVISAVPASLVGWFTKDWIETNISNLSLIGSGFLYTSLLLGLSYGFRRGNRSLENLSFYFPFVVGLFQAVALLPGVSRSGSCIAVGLILGANPKVAGEFAFFCGIPVILGAFFLCLKDLITSPGGDGSLGLYGIAFFSSVLMGVVFLKLLLRLLYTGWFPYFGIYTTLLAAVCFYLVMGI